MAEYIKREELFHQGEWMYDPKAECEADALHFVVKTNTINLIPTANVVEREKIDKAIRITKDCISACFKIGLNERAFGMREILEVFEENIENEE